MLEPYGREKWYVIDEQVSSVLEPHLKTNIRCGRMGKLNANNPMFNNL